MKSPHPLLSLVLALPVAAQKAVPTTETVKVLPPARLGDELASVPGTVNDLSRDAAGRLLYCTTEGEVGRIDPVSRVRTVLATAATGPFANTLHGVVETATGDVAVVDALGDVLVLPGGATPAVLVYDDRHMIFVPTDLIVDARGSYLIASKTPSSNTRATNMISCDGVRWDYHIVRHQPVQIAADPLTGGILMADWAGGGALRLISSAPTHPTSALDTTTQPGFAPTTDDGDMAVEADGDLYWVAGGAVWFHDRGSGQTTLVESGYQQLRAAMIAASSTISTTGWSLYLAEGSNPTRIVERPGVGAPASLVATDQGEVPGRGIQKVFTIGQGIQVFDIAADNDGNILLGGAIWGSNPSIRRFDTTTETFTTVAQQSDGITERIEGIAVAPDDTIYALTSSGPIHAVTENPLVVTTVYSDPFDDVIRGKDLALDVDGTLYVADRECWGCGEVVAISAGAASSVVPTKETRGLSAHPSGGLFVTQWNGSGFCGSVDRYDFGTGTLDPVAGLSGINYANDGVWGDGDTVVDVLGRVYTLSEDDWSVVRYEPSEQAFVRVLSGFLNRPSGLAIAPSTPSVASASGWSLYVSEFDYLWELPDVQPPASGLVDSTAMMGSLVATIHPRLGKPRDLTPSGESLYVSTSRGFVLEVDPRSGFVHPVAGPADGLAGDLVALAARADGRLTAARRDGTLFAIDPRRASGALAPLVVEEIYADAGDVLGDVRGITVDARDRLLIVDRDAAGGWIHRLGAGDAWPEPLAHAARGLRAAVDPLRGGLLVTDGWGALRRISLEGPGARAGRAVRPLPRAEGSTTLAFGGDDGGVVFDAAGNAYLAVGRAGRVVRLDRADGSLRVLSGNHAGPVAVALAPGTPERAGTDGTSLFVLDGWVVWEIGVEGLPANAAGARVPRFAGGRRAW